MRMFVAALIAGAVIGFVDAKFLMGEIQKQIADPATQSLLAAGIAAFLGSLWGWFAKGLIGSKAKD